MWTIALAMFGLCVNAQITVTSEDFAEIDKLYIYSTDTFTVADNVTFGSLGNSPWDFTTFTEDNIDTTKFVDPQTTQYATDFPDATHAGEYEMEGAFSFLKTDANAVQLLGMVIDIEGITTLLAQLAEPISMMEFPVTYGSNFEDQTSFSVSDTPDNLGIDLAALGLPAIIDSLRFELTYGIDANVGSHGDLTTILGEYPTLLQSVENHIVIDVYAYILFGWSPDPLYASDSTFMSYRWLANGMGLPVATANEDSNGKIRSITWLKYHPDYVDIQSVNEVKCNVYPNPTTDFFHIEMTNESAYSYEIINQLGAKVAEGQLDNGAARCDVKKLSTGLYIIGIRNKSGQQIATKKAMILRK